MAGQPLQALELAASTASYCRAEVCAAELKAATEQRPEALECFAGAQLLAAVAGFAACEGVAFWRLLCTETAR